MARAADDRPEVLIRQAAWPGDEAAANGLLLSYAAHLSRHAGISETLGDRHRELDRLAQLWSPPHGVLLLAFLGEQPVGCVAVKVLNDPAGTCELKRLWVEYGMQGHGVGRLLVQAAIAWATGQGADRLLLDTVPAAMPQAVALYRALGFEETERYNSNPVPDLKFMQLRLR